MDDNKESYEIFEQEWVAQIIEEIKQNIDHNIYDAHNIELINLNSYMYENLLKG